tara:strand:+ start:350 stop:811 length:462 start_codon:yes stop_codon:yes gene_type:complete
MSNLRIKLKSYLDASIKKKDDLSVSTVRLIIAAIKDRDIEYRAKNEANEINDPEILNLLQNMIKQRKERVKIYADAGRDELKDREVKEIEIIESFLPKQITDKDLEKIISEVCTELQANTIKDLGKVINTLKERYPGQLDFKVAAGMAKSNLT